VRITGENRNGFTVPPLAGGRRATDILFSSSSRVIRKALWGIENIADGGGAHPSICGLAEITR
jgi:hypothetical protein